MQSEFIDRVLTCVDCRSQFVFTAGEQIFFFDKQFKNDPKRCKPCKGKRQGLGGTKSGCVSGMSANSRTETRTECSECHIETTVPFKPTQGRPVLCRQCFQCKRVLPVREQIVTDAMPATVFGLTTALDPIPEPFSETVASQHA